LRLRQAVDPEDDPATFRADLRDVPDRPSGGRGCATVRLGGREARSAGEIAIREC
jgi:hypothetical protein